MKSPGPERIGHDTGTVANHPARDQLDAPVGPARVVRPDAMPTLFGIEFFQIDDGHRLRINMEVGGPWNHLFRLSQHVHRVNANSRRRCRLQSLTSARLSSGL